MYSMIQKLKLHGNYKLLRGNYGQETKYEGDSFAIKNKESFDLSSTHQKYSSPDNKETGLGNSSNLYGKLKSVKLQPNQSPCQNYCKSPCKKEINDICGLRKFYNDYGLDWKERYLR